jgi:uncharacterized protein YjeT (DUF2065 family)
MVDLFERNLKRRRAMTIPQSIEFIVGFGFIVLGLSYLLSTDAWIAEIEHLMQNPQRSGLKVGGTGLAAGVFVLGFHWVWQGPQIVTTILGVLMALKGIAHLLCPAWFSVRMKMIECCIRPALRLGGLLVFALGAYVFYELLTQPSVQDYLCNPFHA